MLPDDNKSTEDSGYRQVDLSISEFRDGCRQTAVAAVVSDSFSPSFGSVLLWPRPQILLRQDEESPMSQEISFP